MRHYLLSAGLVLASFLLLFVVGEAAGISVLEDPTPLLAGGGWPAGAAGVLLLAADVVLPVPSNVVTIVLGGLFGLVVGALLGLTGTMLAAVAAFWIGRRGGWLLALAVPADERARADKALARWGVLAIILARPLPLLAETVIVLAGASAMSWRTAMTAAAIGSLPQAVVYSWAGSASLGLEGGALAFGLVIVLVAGVGLVIRQLERRADARHAAS